MVGFNCFLLRCLSVCLRNVSGLRFLNFRILNIDFILDMIIVWVNLLVYCYSGKYCLEYRGNYKIDLN